VDFQAEYLCRQHVGLHLRQHAPDEPEIADGLAELLACAGVRDGLRDQAYRLAHTGGTYMGARGVDDA